MNPINPIHLRRSTAIRDDFTSDHPLPGFAVIPDFADRDLVEQVLSGCKNAHFDTYCGYSPSEDGANLKFEYCQPNESDYYITIHQRARAPIPQIVRLKELFRSQEAIATLNELTGRGISQMYDSDVLTYWNPGSFLEQHTDQSPDDRFRLVLSISLTENWDRAYGGATLYAWKDLDRCVCLQPRLNTAVLFIPFEGSDHWVEQISNNAPPLTRFTWTAFFS